MPTDWLVAPPYPIPGDDEILRTRHLRALALMTIRQAALAAQAGGWGFFLPADLKPGTANRIVRDNSGYAIQNLAVLTRVGLAIRHNELRIPAEHIAGNQIKVSWAVPAHAKPDDPVPLAIRLVAGEDKTDDDGASEVLGSIALDGNGKPRLASAIPFLSSGATPECWEAVKTVADLLKGLAEAMESTKRGDAYVRAATRARLLACATAMQRWDVPMTQVVIAIREALAGLVAIVEAYADGAISPQERREIAASVESSDTVDEKTPVNWLLLLPLQFGDGGPVIKWLKTPGDGLQARTTSHISGGCIERAYAIGSAPAEQLLIRFDVRGHVPPRVEIWTDQKKTFDTLPLEYTGRGFQASRNAKEFGAELRLRVFGDAEPDVRFQGGDSE
jgi:hypothetical protein